MVLKLRKLGIKASNGLQFGVETMEIWPIEAWLHKRHVVKGLHTGPIPIGCLGWFFCLSFWAHFGGN